VFVERANKAFPPFLQWSATQRLLYVWFSLVTYPITALKDTFRAFKAPKEFDSHVSNLLNLLKLKENSFSHTLTAAILPSSSASSSVTSAVTSEGVQQLEYCVLNVNDDSSEVELRELRSGKVHKFRADDKDMKGVLSHPLARTAALLLWKQVQGMIRQWSGFKKSRKNTCYGLHELDYDIVRALKDNTNKLAESLTPTQLAGNQVTNENILRKVYRVQQSERMAPRSVSQVCTAETHYRQTPVSLTLFTHVDM
jgi:hypothetical protein